MMHTMDRARHETCMSVIAVFDGKEPMDIIETLSSCLASTICSAFDKKERTGMSQMIFAAMLERIVAAPSHREIEANVV